MVGKENEPDPYACVVHPTEIEHDSRMVTGNSGAFASRTFGQDDGGNENGKCDAEHANRLVHDSCQYVSSDFFIPQINGDRYEAKQVLCVDRSTNPDARDIWIGGKASVEFHGGQKRRAAIHTRPENGKR